MVSALFKATDIEFIEVEEVEIAAAVRCEIGNGTLAVVILVLTLCVAGVGTLALVIFVFVLSLLSVLSMLFAGCGKTCCGPGVEFD